MNSRRKFLVQGSMATTAMIALKPLATLARVTSPFTGSAGSSGKLVFLHTSSMEPSRDELGVQYIKKLKNKHSNAVLVHAGNDMSGGSRMLAYDVSVSGTDHASAISGDYKIINKGRFKIGVIHAAPGEDNVIQQVDDLSARLKKEKNCHVVVCISQLGYRNKNTADDLALAKRSTHLDLIIGGHVKNFHAHPVIALNSKEEEVIIHSASGNPAACGVIHFDFNSEGQKRSIAFSV